jgi:hypothetical protein
MAENPGAEKNSSPPGEITRKLRPLWWTGVACGREGSTQGMGSWKGYKADASRRPVREFFLPASSPHEPASAAAMAILSAMKSPWMHSSRSRWL